VGTHLGLESDQTACAGFEVEAVLDPSQIVGLGPFGEQLTDSCKVEGIRRLHSRFGRVGGCMDAFGGRGHAHCGRGSEQLALKASEVRGEATGQSSAEVGPHGSEEVGGQGWEAVSVSGRSEQTLKIADLRDGCQIDLYAFAGSLLRVVPPGLVHSGQYVVFGAILEVQPEIEQPVV